MFLSELREFPSAPCLAGLDDSSRLDVVEIAHIPDMLPSLFPFWSGQRLISTPVHRCGSLKFFKNILKREHPHVTFPLQPHLLTVVYFVPACDAAVRVYHPCNVSLYVLLQKC